MSADANREGFRILRREPSLFLIELLWRWSFGLGVLALVFLCYAQLRQAIILSESDTTAFSSLDPMAIAAATQGVLATAMPLILRTLAPACAIAVLLWIAAATIGRSILTRAIVQRLAAEYGLAIVPATTSSSNAPRWAAFAILHSARVLMLLILVVGYLGGAFIAQFAGPVDRNLLISAGIVFVCCAISFVLWNYVNWVLSLAAIFLVIGGPHLPSSGKCGNSERGNTISALDSVVEAIAFIRRNYSKLASIALWNSTMRGLAATLISIAASFTAFSVLPAWATAALLAFATLAYLAVSDAFLLARLAAYVSVALRGQSLSKAISVPNSSSAASN